MSEPQPEFDPEPEPAPPLPPDDEIRFVCIGCGTANPAGATVCAGCGHEFGGALPAGPVAPGRVGRPRRREPATEFNPYEPPAVTTHRAPAIRLSTAMVGIAVIAVGLGAFSADTSLGLLSLIGLVPALCRATFLSIRADREGRPLTLGELIGSLIMTFFTSYLIVLASLIAFGVTCVPAGFASGSIGFACIVGLLVAVPVGIALARAALRVARRWPRDSDVRWR